jgi:hypothetical protein
MSAVNGDSFYEALMPRLRAGAAMVTSPWFDLEQDELLRAWLLALPFADDAVSELNVTLAVDGGRLRWSAAGAAEYLIPVMADFFAHVGADPAALEYLNQVGSVIGPPEVGHWLEARPGALNAGWTFPNPVVLDDVLGLLPAGPPVNALRQWAAQYGIDYVSRLGAAVGGGNPYSMIALPLPDEDDVERQMFVALQLLERLPAQFPPDEALAVLLSGIHGGLSVSLWLTARGVVKAGIVANRPDRLLSLDLAQVVGVYDFEPLARVEGSMLVDGPAAAEALTRVNGFGVMLHYELWGDAPGE